MNSPSGPDNTTKVYGSGWVATILTNFPIDGWTHVYCTSIGESRGQALEACEWVLNSLAMGREAFIRVKPESSSDLDFDTKINHHRGIVRFSFKLTAGGWAYPEPNLNIPFGRIS